MHRTRVAEAATRTALVPVVAAVVAAVIAGVITGGWAGAVLSGLDVDHPTTTLLVEGGNRGW